MSTPMAQAALTRISAPVLNRMALKRHAGQLTQAVIWGPALAHDGISTTTSANAVELICSSRTASSCSGSSSEEPSGT
jgi:hypothetical protein